MLLKTLFATSLVNDSSTKETIYVSKTLFAVSVYCLVLDKETYSRKCCLLQLTVRFRQSTLKRDVLVSKTIPISISQMKRAQRTVAKSHLIHHQLLHRLPGRALA